MAAQLNERIRLPGASGGECSWEARRLLEAGAVLGGSFLLGPAARLAGLSDPGPALEESVAAGLLAVPHPAEGRAIRFTDPSIRAAVARRMGTARRASLRARAAELLGGGDLLLPAGR